ncbi:MAG: glycosyltransferase family 2 protein [Prevotella sp.]|nr:glycosyltransferase family 2 protein [Prevotella sp.]
MKLSIVIPVYRVEKTLQRCVESVLEQSFRDFQLILVDDGSPDDCPRLCDEWAQKDSRIEVIHKTNGGLSSARNSGISKATGEFITFVDSDDYVSTDTYEKVLPLTEDCDIVEFPYCKFNDAQSALECLSLEEKEYTDMDEYWLEGEAYRHTYAWNKIYRRTLFDEVQFPEGRVFEDVATLPSLLSKANKVRTTRQGLYHYYQNAEGITATATGEQLALLLQSHVDLVKANPRFLHDTRYHLYMLNIQLDVAKFKGQSPILPHAATNPFLPGLNIRQRLKALANDHIGVRGMIYLLRLLRQ